MAMLAEPKKRSKYRLQPFSGLSKLNKRCDDDTNSIAFKLMAGMGWAPGKGLGLNESGNVDPIKLRLKNDEAGLGYKVSEDDAVAQQSEFQALLLQLNSGALDENNQPGDPEKKFKKEKIRSLEKQSEQSSVRVHYKKFTRGKDLSRASEKDLRSILGISSVKPKVAEPVLEVAEPSYGAPLAHEGTMYTISGSSVDYFKKKHQEKRKENNTSVQPDTMTENDCKQRRSVSWGDVDVSYVDKYIKDMLDTSGSGNDSSINNVQEKQSKEETIKKKKNKKKKIYEQVETENSKTNTEETVVATNEYKKSKKRKLNEEDSSKDNLGQDQDNHNVSKKKKKRKANLTDQDTEALSPEEPMNSNVGSDKVLKKKKKKKKNKVSAAPNEIE